MRLINRAMGENAKLFMHISVPTGRDYEKLHVRRCEKIPNAQVFDNGTGESHFQGDCARRKRFWRRSSGHEGFAHAPAVDSHRNLHLLTCFYCALKAHYLCTTSWIENV